MQAERDPFASLEWRLVGPHRGGRVVAVTGHPTDRATFYFGGCAGGVWQTTDGGAYWEPISDGQFTTAAVGALALAEADPNVLYAGTGEACIRSNVSHGDGVYRSTDGGRTWRNVGLADTRHISAIAIHPRDPDVVYVGALGHAWGPNEARGVYRTRDGGRTWERVLYKSPRAGVASLTLDPRNPRILFATLWQAQRHPYALHSGGADSGLWRSTDGGETWQEITRNKGLPAGLLGRMGVSASPARAGRVWAIVEAAEGEGAVYRSDDYGDTWQKLSAEPDLRRRPWYYMYLTADPLDADTVYVCNMGFWKSIDGGKTFETIPTPHGDNHALWIDPRDNRRMIEGNDGGACVTFNGGASWSSILNQPTAQFYHVAVDDHVPYRLYGSQQDNFAMRIPSLGREGAIGQPDWVEPGGGESGYIAISPRPPHTVFAGGIGAGLGHGRLLAWDPETGQKRNVTVWPEVVGFLNSAAGAGEHKYRFQWTFPIEFSPHDPDVLYVTSQHVHRSTDGGHSWEVISPDLTRNNPEWLGSSGGPITADNSGAEIYCTIFAFRESPHEPGVLWAGSDDGLVHISRDGGKSWQDVTPPEGQLPPYAQILLIEPSPHTAAAAYLVATRYKVDDTRPYLFKTDDYGQSWRAIDGDLPRECIARVVREDPAVAGLLYLGTETGLHVSFDDGGSWRPFQANLPVAPIHDLVVKDGDLVAATHGRAFWILDDLSPVRELAGLPGGTGEQRAHLFKPGYAFRYRVYGRAYGSKRPDLLNYMMNGPVTVAYREVETPMGTKAQRFLDAGANPPNGAVIHYSLRDAPGEDEEVALTFTDGNGREVRRYSSKADEPPRVPAAAGMNRFVWDLRTRPPAKLDAPPGADPMAQMMEQSVAPRVLPGDYRVQLTVGDTTLTQSFTVAGDPILAGKPAADLAAQFALATQITQSVDEINQALNQINRVRRQVDEWAGRAERAGRGERLAGPAEKLKQQLADIEGRLVVTQPEEPQGRPYQPKERLMALAAMLDESDDRPTRGMEEVYQALARQVEQELEQLDRVIGQEVAEFSRAIGDSGVAPIAP